MIVVTAVHPDELRRESRASDPVRRPGADPAIRAARAADVDAVHRLISDHVHDARLLSRTREDVVRHIQRFLVAVDEGRIVGCADLAPLSRRVAEVRSLVVDAGSRSCGIGRRLVRELERRAAAAGFESLTAFTHTPGFFTRMGFSIVPHVWVPEKIEIDCRTCAHFRQCAQHAVMLPLLRMPGARTARNVPHA